MSVRFTAASSQKLARTTGLVDYNSDYTFVGWFYFLTTAWQTLFHVTGAVGSRNDEDTLQYNGDFGCLYIDVLKGGVLLGQTGNLSGSFPVSANTWYHIGVVRSGTTLQIYQNGVSVTSGGVTASVSGRTASAQMMIAAANAGDYGNFRMAGVKLYSSALTAEQISSESAALRPLFLGGAPLIAIPGLNTYDDLAGYSWTPSGTPTFEDGPAVGYGAPVIVYPYAASSAITISCTRASLTLAARTATVVPGSVSIAGTRAALALTPRAATIVPVTTIAATRASLTLTPRTAAVVPGAVTVSAVCASLTLSGRQSTIVPGGVTIAAIRAVLSLAARTASVVAMTTIAATRAALTLAGRQSTIIPGAVTVSAVRASLTLTGRQASISSPGGGTILARTASLALAGRTASIVPGAVSITALRASLTLTGRQASIVPVTTIPATRAELSLTPRKASIVPGGATVSAFVLVLTARGWTMTIVGGTATIPGHVAAHMLFAQAEGQVLHARAEGQLVGRHVIGRVLYGE